MMAVMGPTVMGPTKVTRVVLPLVSESLTDFSGSFRTHTRTRTPDVVSGIGGRAMPTQSVGQPCRQSTPVSIA